MNNIFLGVFVFSCASCLNQGVLIVVVFCFCDRRVMHAFKAISIQRSHRRGPILETFRAKIVRLWRHVSPNIHWQIDRCVYHVLRHSAAGTTGHRCWREFPGHVSLQPMLDDVFRLLKQFMVFSINFSSTLFLRMRSINGSLVFMRFPHYINSSDFSTSHSHQGVLFLHDLLVNVAVHDEILI